MERRMCWRHSPDGWHLSDPYALCANQIGQPLPQWMSATQRVWGCYPLWPLLPLALRPSVGQWKRQRSQSPLKPHRPVLILAVAQGEPADSPDPGLGHWRNRSRRAGLVEVGFLWASKRRGCPALQASRTESNQGPVMHRCFLSAGLGQGDSAAPPLACRRSLWGPI